MLFRKLALVIALGISTPAKAVVTLKRITATVFSDRKVSGGKRINPETCLGVALPHHDLLGKKVTVHCIETGVTMVVPVVDVGPWNICDEGILEGERPKAERGISCLKRYGYKARNPAGIDLTPALHRALGMPDETRRYLVDVSIPKLESTD